MIKAKKALKAETDIVAVLRMLRVFRKFLNEQPPNTTHAKEINNDGDKDCNYLQLDLTTSESDGFDKIKHVSELDPALSSIGKL